jgi:hypothetical protein
MDYRPPDSCYVSSSIAHSSKKEILLEAIDGGTG